MKKSVFILIIGAVCLVSGIYLYTTQGQDDIIYVTSSSSVLTKEEATSLVNDTVKNIISFYENKEDTFKVEKIKEEIVEETEENGEQKTTKANEENQAKDENQGIEEKPVIEIPDGYIKVTNYDEVVKKMFTENGIKELEETEFEKKKYVLKDEENVYLLDKLPEDNQFKDYNITLGVIEIEEKEINCEVTLSTNKMGEDGVLVYYVIVKNLKLVKNDDGWLIDTFAYNNI